MMYQTEFRQLASGSYLRAEFGLHVIGSQAPYMSVTAEEHTRTTRLTDRTWLSGGMLHTEVLEVFPELAALVQWHLATDGIPMHYLANAKYWHDIANCLVRVTKFEDWKLAPERFASTALLGILPSDRSADELLILPWSNVQYILADRMPALREAYRAVVSTIPALVVALNASKVST